jgi:hypothetical protein
VASQMKRIQSERDYVLKVTLTSLYRLTIGRLDSLEYLKSTNSVALVRERTIPTERPPLVSEVSANLCG